MYDGFEETAYIKKYSNIFTEPKFKELFSADILREQVERDFHKKKEKYSKDDEFFEFFMEDLELKKAGDLESIAPLEKKKRKRTYANGKKDRFFKEKNY